MSDLVLGLPVDTTGLEDSDMQIARHVVADQEVDDDD